MKLEARVHRGKGEPVIALINVVFLILIFVMVTTVIEPVEPVDVVLPEGSTDLGGINETELLIDERGNLSFEQQRVNTGELIDLLTARGIERVTIRADAELAAGSLFALTNALENANIHDISLATVRP